LMTNASQVGMARAAVREVEMTPTPIPAENVVAGNPEASMALVWKNEASTVGLGVWHCTPGTFYLEAPDETVVLIEGHATLTAPARRSS
jgi:uncharacterized protein